MHTLKTRKQLYMSWMERAYKMERIKRSRLPYRMKLAAMTAADNQQGKEWK